MSTQKFLLNLAKPINTGKATKSLFPRLEALLAPTLLFVAFLLPLESIQILQFIYFIRFFKKNNMYLFYPNILSSTWAREPFSLMHRLLKFSTRGLRAGGTTFLYKPRIYLHLMGRTDYLYSTVAGDANKLRVCT